MPVVSRAPSAARAGGTPRRPAAPANESVVRKRRRVCVMGIGNLPSVFSRLQLTFELVEEAPIGTLGNDLLRARFDHADFVQAQRVKADRVLGIVFAPFVVGNVAYRLLHIFVASRRKAA